MKISKFLLSLMISGSTLGTAAAQDFSLSGTPASATDGVTKSKKHIGDSSVALANDSVVVDDTQSNGSRTQRFVDYNLAPTAASFTPAAPAAYNHSAMQEVAIAPTATVGYESCGTSCVSSCAPCDCGPNAWFSTESLLWWGQARSAPPLLTTAATGVLPVAGANGVTTLAGGEEGISSGLLPGYRLSGGFYFGPQKKIGVSGRVFGLFRNEDTFSATSDATGSTSIGLPFFNTNLGTNDAYLVAFNNGLPIASGTAAVTSRLDLIAVEPSLRFLVGRSQDHKVELLGGYTYLRLKDSLNITSASTDRNTGNLIPDGTVFSTRDLFATENTFHGGHIGLETGITRRRVSLSTLAKVSIGNFSQTSVVSGSTTIDPAFGPIPNGGVYAQQSNSGTITRDRFGFIPELGLKGGLNLRSNLQLTAGYTFLYLSNVALAGNQIDRNVDLLQGFGPAGVQPTAGLRDGSQWFQGLDLGLNWTF